MPAEEYSTKYLACTTQKKGKYDKLLPPKGDQGDMTMKYDLGSGWDPKARKRYCMKLRKSE